MGLEYGRVCKLFKGPHLYQDAKKYLKSCSKTQREPKQPLFYILVGVQEELTGFCWTLGTVSIVLNGDRIFGSFPA